MTIRKAKEIADWIPVSDTPPDDGQYILCRKIVAAGSTTRVSASGTYIQGEWRLWNGCGAVWNTPAAHGMTEFTGEVTHYMPLPAPPEESENNEKRRD